MILEQRPLLRLWLIRTGIAAGGLLIACLLLLWAATGPIGRWAVMQIADDRVVARGLVLDLDGLSGNVLAGPRLQRLAVSDGEGEFLHIEDLAIEWNALALLSGRVDIHSLVAARIDMDRRPSLVAAASAGGNLPAVRISRLDVDALRFGEAVLGTEALFTLSGEARLRADGAVAFEARRTDVVGDRLLADLTWQAGGDIEGVFEAELAADSPLAALAGLSGVATSVTGRLQGTADRGTGEAAFSLADRVVSEIEIGWQDNRWSLDAYTDATRFPPRLETPFDASSTARLAGSLSPFLLDSANVEGRDWQIEIRPTGARQFDASLTLSREFLAVLAPDRLTLGQLRWNGEIDLRAGMTADGIVELSGLEAPGLMIEAVGGGVTVARRDGATTLNAELTATSIDVPDAASVPLIPWAGLTLEAGYAGGIIDLPVLALSSDLGDLTAELAIATADWTVSGEAGIAIADIARFTDRAAGPVSARVDISSLSPDGTSLTLRADGGNLVWSDPRLRPLLAAATLTGEIESDYSSWQVSRLRLRGDGVLATGDISGERANWQAALDAAIIGDLDFGQAVMQGGAALALEATGEGRTADANLVVFTEQLRLAGQTLEAPRLGLELVTGQDNQTAGWQIEAGTRFGQLVARGTAERTDEITRIRIAEGAIGPRPFTGEATVDRGDIAARLDGTDWTIGDGDISQLAATARRESGVWTFGTDLTGAFREPFTVSATASLAGGELAAEMTGQWADTPIRTREPVTYRFAEDTRGVLARFRVGTGRANLRWTEDRQFRVQLEDLPADLLVAPLGLPDLTGRLDAVITLRERQGVWSGEASAAATQLRLRRFAAAVPLSLAMQASLSDTLDTRIDLSGEDLSGTLQLQRRGGPVSGLGELRADAPLSGTVALSGTLEPLLSLILPETRQLAGQLSADLVVDGTVYRPQLDGDVRFENGRYVSEDLGVNIETIDGVARFDDGRLRIESFSARDPSGGTLTANGEAFRGENGWEADSRVQFTRFNAVRRPDLNIVVSGHSDVTLAAEGITISGEAELNRVDARPPEASAPSFAEIEVTEINRPDGRNGNGRERLPVRLDYRVSADDSIFISGDPFSSEWRGEWQVGGSPTNLEINGTAELISGRAFLLNRSFRLERGRVVLSGPVRSASLDLTAIHSRDNLTVNARIKGPVSAPALSLSSEPTLPEDEILARLLFDQNAGQLSALQTATIAAQLSGQSIFGLVGGLRRAAGLDRLDFDTTANGEFVVTGGQRISDDVYLELESRGAALSSARLEWTLRPDFTLLSRLTGDTDASVALRWRTEYD